jgi:hypothetical protein
MPHQTYEDHPMEICLEKQPLMNRINERQRTDQSQLREDTNQQYIFIQFADSGSDEQIYKKQAQKDASTCINRTSDAT